MLVKGAAFAKSSPALETFYKVRAGQTTYQGLALTAPKKPILVKRGTALEFAFLESEIINIARLLAKNGELLLETRSLDGVINLDTENLRPGTYKYEVESGQQKGQGTVQVR